MELVENILTQNPCYQAGKKITVRGLMLHSVGCPQPSAEVFVRKWNNPEAARACVHAFIDGNTGKIYQTLPWEHRAWHGGGSSNNTHIGVEMCEPACIKYTGGASFTCSDRDAAMAVVKRTYDAAVELFAFLCQKFGLDPLADGVIVSHKEGHDRGIASGHGDPDHLWNGLKSGYTMDGFRKDVNAAMGQPAPKPQLSPATSQSIPAAVQSIPAAAQPAPAAGSMAISDRGVELIAGYEGCKLEAYLCPAGVWTIGYGHTAGVKQGDRLPSQEAARALLKEDLKKYGDYVNACVRKGLISFPLTQNQFDALTSFCYNCGNGNLQKLVSGRDAATVAEKLLLYNKGGGKVLTGLVRRREEERALFLS
ncbi:MAG: N-acetylmuramoyl-L-alanine amidase [Lachnospiraceae bacterium]|nr:N-acetylmuramoyl-L-alanine amidase [Lachnospiraceae bacterium]